MDDYLVVGGNLAIFFVVDVFFIVGDIVGAIAIATMVAFHVVGLVICV